MNLADARATRSRRAQLALLAAGPDRVLAALRQPRSDLELEQAPQLSLPHLDMPVRHDVRAGDLVTRRLHGALAAAADRAPEDFADLLLTPGVGERSVFALALAAEVIYGAPCRFTDPARYSLALGGKDGHPFPVPLRVYDETIRVLRRAVDAARLSNDDRLAAIRRLDAQARILERAARGPAFEEVVAAERARSGELGGRTVVDGAANESPD